MEPYRKYNYTCKYYTKRLESLVRLLNCIYDIENEFGYKSNGLYFLLKASRIDAKSIARIRKICLNDSRSSIERELLKLFFDEFEKLDDIQRRFVISYSRTDADYTNNFECINKNTSCYCCSIKEGIKMKSENKFDDDDEED